MDTITLNLIGIAGALVVIDGPLLQRASTVVRGSQTSNLMLNLKLTPELPNGFAGSVLNGLIAETFDARHLLNDYVKGKPMVLNVTPSCGKGGTVCQ